MDLQAALNEASPPVAGVARRRFTAEEYRSLADAGILGEDDRVELVGGEIVELAAMGARHAMCVTRADRQVQRTLGDAAVVRVQLPLALGERDEPEPDLAVVRPRSDDYGLGHPGPSDVLLLIEVADTSAAYDREIKVPLYAREGVPESWLFDLNGERIERHTEPGPQGYRLTARAGRGESLPSAVLPELVFDADSLLGPPRKQGAASAGDGS
jgi:Uma2 family endonuclease